VQLLQNRPDIAAALRRLEASDQDLAAARADRLPSLRLTGGAAYDSDELEELFDNWIVSLAASLTAPILDGSRRRAEVEINRAAVQQQLAEYRQVVLTAVREVEDALISETKIREHIAALESQLQAAQNALTEAGTRYVNGLNDYLPVLTQLLSVQNLEIDLIRRHEDLLVARIDLYRAIGGSWVDDLTPPAQNN
jgi:outer membrane protein TolC